MRRIHRAVVLVTLLALGPLMAGCADLDLDKLDVFNLNQKKKLPGERKDVFPGGVPGVTQGIPPEYLRENQIQPQAAMAPGEGVSAETQGAVAQPMQTAPQPVQAEKPKPKPRAASRPTRVNVGGAPTQTAPAQQPQQQQGAAEPQPQQQPGQSPWPAPNQSSSNAPWPSSPAPGTFSR